MDLGRDPWLANAAWPVILAAAALAACHGQGRSTDEAGGPASAVTSASRPPDGPRPRSASGAPPLPPAATRYDPARTTSPVTPSVARRLRAIARARPRRDDVFMKVGASGTTSGHFLSCFGASDDPRHELDLAGHQDLMPTIELFRTGNAGGRNPFERVSRAAVSGKSAGWVLAGSPSPLALERDAVDPRFAFVDFGTNDLHYGASPRAALPRFYAALSEVLEQLETGGTIPIVSGLPPRDHDASAERWVPTYDVVTRGLAEQRQVPYLSLYQATKDLPDRGLVRDGVHGNAYREHGVFQPCVFHSSALDHHYNVRNLESIRLLDVVKRVVVDGRDPPDSPPPTWPGEGSSLHPFEIDQLPYTHSPPGEERRVTEYQLTLHEKTALRVLVLTRDATAGELDLFEVTPDGMRAVATGQFAIEGALQPGTYRVVVTAPPAPDSRARLLAVLRCEPGDPDCR